MTRAERVFWVVWTVVAVGLIVAGLVVGRHGQAQRFTEYIPDESRPEHVVHNAYVAAQRNDVDRFLGYFKEPAFGENGQVAGLESFALRNGEIRIQDVQVTDGTAVVKVVWLHTVGGFLWGPEVRVQEAEVHLERVGERWLIRDRQLPFVYVVWEVPSKPVPPGGD